MNLWRGELSFTGATNTWLVFLISSAVGVFVGSVVTLIGQKNRKPRESQMTPELDAELKSAETTVLQVKRVLNKDKPSDDERSTSVVGIIDQAIEHHAAILLLLRTGMAGSAFALTRPVTEAVVRGVWLTACATDAEVMKFVSKDKIGPTHGEMSEAIDKTCGIDYFAAFKKQSWNALNSYTHTGMLQIGRRFTGDKLLPFYTDAEKVGVLRVITASILLLVRPFLARQGHLDSAKEIDKLMVRPEK